MCACTWRPKVATSCLTFFETGSLLHVQLTDCLVWLADLMLVPRTGVTNAHYCPPFFNVATRDLNSGSHACMAKSSLSPAPSWLVVGDRSPYAALEGLTLESGMASTSSSPAFGLCSPEIPRFLPHCLPPLPLGCYFPKSQVFVFIFLSPVQMVSPLYQILGGV